MINVATGELIFDDGFSIAKGMSFRDIDAKQIGSSFPSSTNTVSLSLGKHYFKDQLWGVGAILTDARIRYIVLSILSSPKVNPDAWDIAVERIRQSEHDEWLKSHFPRYIKPHSKSVVFCEFKWGVITSSIDLKGVQANVVIDYQQ
jgi:hypothetical protein